MKNINHLINFFGSIETTERKELVLAQKPVYVYSTLCWLGIGIFKNKSCPKLFGKSRVAKSPLVTMGRSKFTPKTALSFDDHLHLIHSSLDRLHSPSQTASGSVQPCCHSTLSGQTDQSTDRPTDTQTDRWTRLQVSKIRRLHLIVRDAANKRTFLSS